MYKTLAFKIVLLSLFVIELPTFEAVQIERLTQEDLSAMKRLFPELYIGFKNLIRKIYLNETPLNLLNNFGIVVPHYYVPSNELFYYNEQWMYFCNNYLKQSYGDHKISWVQQNVDKIIKSISFSRGITYEAASKVVSDWTAFNFLLKQIYLKAVNEIFTKAENTNYKQSYYKLIKVKFENSSEFKVKYDDLFRDAEFITRYCGGGDASILLSYCKLIDLKKIETEQKLCQIAKEPRRATVKIERVYHHLKIDSLSWYYCFGKQKRVKEMIDYVKLIECYWMLTKSKENFDLKNDSGIYTESLVTLLSSLSYNRFPSFDDKSSQRLQKGPYLKHVKTTIFSKELRLGQDSLLEQQSYRAYYNIPSTFKVVVLNSSLIDNEFMKLIKDMPETMDSMKGFVKFLSSLGAPKMEGLDPFMLEDNGPDNYFRWTFIKTYFMITRFQNAHSTYLNIIEKSVIKELAERYSYSKDFNRNRLLIGFEIYKAEFMDYFLYNLYIYCYEKVLSEIRLAADIPNKVKIIFMPTTSLIEIYDLRNPSNKQLYYNPYLIDAKKGPCSISMEIINRIKSKPFEIKDWLESTLLEDKQDQLACKYVKPVIYIKEADILKNVELFELKELSKKVNDTVLETFLNFILRPSYSGIDKTVDFMSNEANSKIISPEINYLNQRIPGAESPLLSSVKRGFELFEIKVVIPNWFKNLVTKGITTELPSIIPPLFFREFEVLLKQSNKTYKTTYF